MLHLSSLTLVTVLALLSSVLAANQPAQVNLRVEESTNTIPIVTGCHNQPTQVILRIEGSTHTIFEGLIVTKGHNVTTLSGGTHKCDGTNNNANPFPGPTCTSALDDAAQEQQFTFDGTFFTEFDDFFITSIAGESETCSQFWGIYLNFELIQVGGCQQEVEFKDEILFALVPFYNNNRPLFLQLTGPPVARVGEPVILTVIDGVEGIPAAGADVNGNKSNANGHVSVTFAHTGEMKVKATRAFSVRSNQLTIQVTL